MRSAPNNHYGWSVVTVWCRQVTNHSGPKAGSVTNARAVRFSRRRFTQRQSSRSVPDIHRSDRWRVRIRRGRKRVRGLLEQPRGEFARAHSRNGREGGPRAGRRWAPLRSSKRANARTRRTNNRARSVGRTDAVLRVGNRSDHVRSPPRPRPHGKQSAFSRSREDGTGGIRTPRSAYIRRSTRRRPEGFLPVFARRVTPSKRTTARSSAISSTRTVAILQHSSSIREKAGPYRTASSSGS